MVEQNTTIVTEDQVPSNFNLPEVNLPVWPNVVEEEEEAEDQISMETVEPPESMTYSEPEPSLVSTENIPTNFSELPLRTAGISEHDVYSDDEIKEAKRTKQETYEKLTRNKNRPPLDEEVYNAMLEEHGKLLDNYNVSDEDYRYEMEAYARKINTINNIGSYDNTEDAESSLLLGDQQIYYLPAKGRGRRIGMYNFRRSRDERTFAEKNVPLLIAAVDAGINNLYKAGRAVNAFSRSAVRGGIQNPVELVGDIYFGLSSIPYSEIPNLAISWPSTWEWFLNERDEGARAVILDEFNNDKDKFFKSLARRQDEIKASKDEWDNWMYEWEEAMNELPTWRGINSKEYFLGRVGEMFGEEMPIARALSFIKFRKGMKLAKDSRISNVEFKDADELSKALNIPIKDAKLKLELIRKGHHDPKVYAAYKLRDMEMAIGFATGFNAINTWLQQKNEEGVPLNSGILSMQFGYEMMGGFGGAMFSPARIFKDVKGKHSFRALAYMYHTIDVLAGRKTAGGEVKLGSDGLPIRELSEGAGFKRTYAYLRATGFSDAEIQQAKASGDLDDLKADALTLNKFGKNFGRFVKYLESLPEDIKNQLLMSAEANFDALNPIVLEARKNGVDIGIFLDNVLELARLTDFKVQTAKSKKGYFGSLWQRITETDEMIRIDENSNKLRMAITKHVEKAKQVLDADTDMSEETREFIAQNIDMAESIEAKSQISRIEIQRTQLEEKLIKDLEPTEIKQNAEAGLTPDKPIVVGDAAARASELVKKLKRDDYKIMKELWTAVDFEHEFGADDLIEALETEFFDPAELASIQSIIKEGIGRGKLRNIITDLKQAAADKLDINQLVIDIANASVNRFDDAQIPNRDEIIRMITTNLDAAGTPEQQKQVLVEIAEQLDIIPTKIKMGDVKSLMSHLGKRATETLGTSESYKYSRLQELIYENVLVGFKPQVGDKTVDGSILDKKVVDAYRRAVKSYPDFADKYKRGAVGKALDKTPRGEPLINPEQIIEELINDRRATVANMKILERIIKEAPQIDKETGEVIYKLRNPEDTLEMEELILDTLRRKIKNNAVNIEALDKLLETPFFVDMLKKRGKGVTELIGNYYDSLIKKNYAQDEAGRSASKDIQNILNELLTSKQKNDNQSIFRLIGSLNANVEGVKAISEFFFTPTQFTRLDNLSETQASILQQLVKAKHANLQATDRAANILTKDVKKIDELVVTPYEALYIMTNGFEGPQGEAVFNNLRKILINGISNEVLSKSDHKYLLDGAWALENSLDVGRLRELLDSTKKIREGTDTLPALFSDEANTILEQASQAGIATEATSWLQGGSRTTVGTMPTSMPLKSIISRIYAVQRGVVSMRYLVGEAGINEIRKKQAAGINQVLTNEASARLLMLTFDPRFVRPEILRKNMPAALRAVAIVAGVTVPEAERWFEDPENEGQVSVEQVSHLLQYGKPNDQTTLNLSKLNSLRSESPRGRQRISRSKRREQQQLEAELKKAGLAEWSDKLKLMKQTERHFLS